MYFLTVVFFWQVTCGTLGLSTATVKLVDIDGEEKIACSIGTGPVDAAYKAVDKIVQVNSKIGLYRSGCMFFQYLKLALY